MRDQGSIRLAFLAALLGAAPAFAQDQSAPPPVAEPVPAPPAKAAGFDATGMGMGGMGGMNGMGMGGGGMGMPGYGVTWYPGRTTSTGEDLGFVRQRLSAALPVWKEDGDAVIFNTNIRNTLFFTKATLPDTGQPFPAELWNVNFGMNYMHQFENGWSGGLMANFGSASDKPFHSSQELNVGGGGFLRVPAMRDGDSWMFFLMYSPVGNVNFPIPGVAYSWNPNEQWHVNIGIPFSVTWKPIDDLSVSLSYMPVTNVNARISYRVAQPLQVYGGFEWLNEAYYLADRVVQKDRFLSYEKRLVGGVRWNVFNHATLDLQAGYAFDRYYGEGQNLIGTGGGSAFNRVNVASGAFIGLNFGIGF
ncbi:DUF6268 family outer membrane beta-barrel protein [Zavarzinella formosa]|uniref:DUF6268 family outer membrane beta-barrel protein n=1 Tax=Zavarzinella formosa TaxID=360055 RepID=UPI0003064769|nr:DUF6268 family outer membrane beta-barrel protein [Zavarzinella formosa]